MTKRVKRRLKRTINILRNQVSNWTVRRLMARGDVHDVSRRTVSRYPRSSHKVSTIGGWMIFEKLPK